MTIHACCSIYGVCSYTFIHHKHIKRLFHSICIQRESVIVLNTNLKFNLNIPILQ